MDESRQASTNHEGSGQQPRRGGVLLLHGFTSSVKTVSGLLPMIERYGWAHRMPVMRGHGTKPRDLKGVSARDWYDDAQAALAELRAEADDIVVVGLSMGGLVALQLAMDDTAQVVGVATACAALRFTSPLAPYAGVLGHILPNFPSPNSFADKECAKESENYRSFPTSSFVALRDYGKVMETRLAEVRLPLLVIQARHDTIIRPESASHLYNRASSTDKELVWLERSNHEVFQDLERRAAFDAVEGFLARLLPAGQPDESALA